MPLSKKRNRQRMRISRLHKRFLPPQTSNPVQLKPMADAINKGTLGKIGYARIGEFGTIIWDDHPMIDDDGNPIPEIT